MKSGKRIKIFLLAVITALSVTGTGQFLYAEGEDASLESRSLDELETMKVKNNVKLDSIQSSIEKSRKNYESALKTESQKKEYYDKLTEKLNLQNQNLEYVVRQINMLESEVQNTNDMVYDIESQIAGYREEADETLEIYKQRLRADYMAEGDSLSSILIGSTSFFDILTKSEIITRISERDMNFLDSLEKKLENLSELSGQLEFKQEIISGNLEEAEKKKAEMDVMLEALKSDYEETRSELEKLSGDRKNFKKDYDTQTAALEEQKKEQEKIGEAIKKAQEKARKEMEELEEQAKKQGLNRNTSTSSGSSVNVSGTTQISVSSSSTDMLWPVPGYTSHSSFYGYREFDNSDHQAIDIQGNDNDTIEFAKIYAAESGTVVTAVNYCTHSYGKSYSCGCGGGYGNYIVLQHSDGVYQTVYAHCYTIYVSEGDTVRKGQLIGIVGSTGYSTGPHLHFEVRKNGVKTNPDSYNYINYG